MLEAFGTLRPTVSQRTSYFFEMWIDWRPHRVKLKARFDQACKNMLRELGLKEFWEYQVREGEVRFSTEEIKAWALVSGLNAFTYKETHERI